MTGPGTALTASGVPASSRSERIVALDALRGIAVAGIALMNVYIFALPAAAYFNPAAAGSEGLLDRIVWALSFVFVEDKFRSLFAMLFGAGVAILLERSAQAPLRAHVMRMVVLFAFGAAHAIFIANNDVLRLYAMAGLVLPLFMRLSPKTLLIGAGLLMSIHVLGGTLFAWCWMNAEPGSQVALYPAQLFGADPAALAYADQIGNEAFSERVVRRLTGFWTTLESQIAGITSTLATMLLGVAFWRNGLLQGRWPVERSLALAGRMAVIALPVLAIFLAIDIASEFAPAIVGAVGLFWSIPFDLLLAIAYAALVMGLCGPHDTALRRRLAAVGRLSLSNYLLTSLTFALLFYNWGFGLYGAFSRTGAFAMAFVPIAMMLVWSPLWLSRFRQGPFEWLWRGLARAKFAPLRR